MTQPIRAALYGTGHGHALGKLRVLRESADWELVGLCEPDAEHRALRMADPAWRDVTWIEPEAALGDPSIRALFVEADVPRLLELGRQAIDAGRHLHLDKPAGTDLEAFRRLLSAAERRGLIVQMGYMFRYHRGFELARRAVAEGWLGAIHAVHGCISNRIAPDARRPLAFHPGGMMLELGCHLIDMLVLLLGRPERVRAVLRHDARANDGLADNTLAVFEWAHALGTVESSALEVHAFPRRRFELLGSAGSLVLQPLEPPALRLALGEPRAGFAAGWLEVAVPDEPRYVRDLAELAACIREERPLPYSYAHDATVQETVLRACGLRDGADA